MAQRIGLGFPCRGSKRPAEHEPEGYRPLTKKFGSLRIDAVANHSGHKERDAPGPLSNSADAMLLDDTKDTTYIHDIDREIAEIEDQEFRGSILPAVSEKLTLIPKATLVDPKSQSNELVLYREPASLTVPKEHDNVQRAIVEFKERVRNQRRGSTSGTFDYTKNVDNHSWTESHGEDAMDIDDVER